MAAREVSAIKPILDQNQVKLVGVGLEELGLEEFIEGKFFQGDLYIDEKKQSYNELGFKRFGFLGLFPAVLSRLSRAAQSRAKSLGLGGMSSMSLAQYHDLALAIFRQHGWRWIPKRGRSGGE